MKSKKCILGIIACCTIFATKMSAQTEIESKLSANLSGDIVSNYVWRGIKQTDGLSIQPAVSVSLGNLTLGSWGSIDVTENPQKEIDFYLSYSKNNLTITATDYWWDGEDSFNYFSSPAEGKAGHSFEGALAYTFPKSFPLSVSWNTFLLGNANKKANGDNSYSTYIELNYPFSIQDIGFKIGTGFTPWASTVYGTDKLSFTSVHLVASKEIQVTESFSIPIFANIVVNPIHEDIHFVFGITLR